MKRIYGGKKSHKWTLSKKPYIEDTNLLGHATLPPRYARSANTSACCDLSQFKLFWNMATQPQLLRFFSKFRKWLGCCEFHLLLRGSVSIGSHPPHTTSGKLWPPSITESPLWHLSCSLTCGFVLFAHLSFRLAVAVEDFWERNNLKFIARIRIFLLRLAYLHALLAARRCLMVESFISLHEKRGSRPFKHQVGIGWTTNIPHISKLGHVCTMLLSHDEAESNQIPSSYVL